MAALVSVVIPVYNMEKYLNKCIDSVLEQSYQNIEIIIVDDGSTDESAEICDVYKKENNNIKVIHKKNQGLVGARKEGLSICSGEYVVYVDADDWIEPHMLSDMVKVMESNEVDIAQCGLIWEYPTGESIINDDIIPEGKFNLMKWDNDFYQNLFINSKDYSKSGLRLNVCSCIFRRNILLLSQKMVPNELCNGEDDALFFASVLQTRIFYKFAYPYYHSLVRKNSMSRSFKMFRPEQVFMIEGVVNRILQGHRFEQLLRPLFNRYLLNLLMLYARLTWKCCFKQLYSVDVGYLPEKTKLVIYGAGEVGQAVYIQCKNNYDIVGWVDSKRRSVSGISVHSVSKISDLKFDYIILAAVDESTRKSMSDELHRLGVSDDKIINKSPFVTQDGLYYLIDNN